MGLKILLTNDDGYEAEGLQALYEHLRQEHECYVVAPDEGRSCCGHAVTTGQALDVVRRNTFGWEVSGTPADCVRVGLLWLRLKPDWVISGVNHGGNLGVDILYSGTIAAAREACHLGFRSMAISQYMRRDIPRDWQATAQRARQVLDTLHPIVRPNVGFWSVNLPAIPPESRDLNFPITHCQPESQSLEFSYETEELREDFGADFPETNREQRQTVQYKSNYHARPRSSGSDVDLCFQGHATVTWLGPGHYLQ
jgi:5'-nucleotidase